MSRGQIFVLSGPPGAGKSTVRQRVLESVEGLAYSVSLTTRAPRPGERDGVDYHFVDRAEFKRRIAAGEMAEYNEIFGNLYGTSARLIAETLDSGRDLFIDIDVDGAGNLKREFSQGAFILLLPPSRAELERRLRGRGTEPEEQVAERLRRVRYEMQKAQELGYTHIVVNDELERAVADVAAIIAAERCRYARSAHLLEELGRV